VIPASNHGFAVSSCALVRSNSFLWKTRGRTRPLTRCNREVCQCADEEWQWPSEQESKLKPNLSLVTSRLLTLIHFQPETSSGRNQLTGSVRSSFKRGPLAQQVSDTGPGKGRGTSGAQARRHRERSCETICSIRSSRHVRCRSLVQRARRRRRALGGNRTLRNAALAFPRARRTAQRNRP